MYQKYTQVNATFATFLLTMFSTLSYGQAFDFTSKDKQFGFWTNESTWEENGSPSTNGGRNNSSSINGYVRREGNLVLGRDNYTVVYDTLWITGNLSLNNNAQIVIEPGGVLIVEGSMTAGQNAGGEIDGVMVIMGDVSVREGSANDFLNDSDGNFYVYGNTFYDGTNISGFYNVPDNEDFERDHSASGLYGWVEGGGVLPITLLSFEGHAATKGVVLEWITETEEHFDFFTVERAGSDFQFEAIGQIAGKGGISQVTSYNFVDEDFLAGVYYYRLKATDYDGSEEYHKVIAVMVDEKKETRSSVFPNPVLDKRVQVQISAANSRLQLINHYGATVFQSDLQVGTNSYTLPEYLPTGYYTVVVTNSQGQREQHRVLIR